MYVTNPWNVDFGDSPFDGDERLITRQKTYRINDDVVVERLNNSLIVDLYKIIM